MAGLNAAGVGPVLRGQRPVGARPPMTSRPNNVLVIPCYNEDRRLDPALVHELVHDRQMHVLLVNDGSRDRTGALIQTIVDAEGGQVWRLDLARNSGKAEAVRRGLLHALECGA
jgi:dolichyl-phosphate beta-glucosyltransferase